MEKKIAKKFIGPLLEQAGITINGNQPWDISIHNEAVYTRILQSGALGLGESYMENWWDCPQLDAFFEKILRAKVDKNIDLTWRQKINVLLGKLFNLQSKNRAQQVARIHYDLGNDLFTAMLDKHMMYSCGYWKNANTLDDAQTAKLKLICEKLQLKPGLRLLDIGCGWGGLAKYAAEKYGVSVVGITISKQQVTYAREYCANLPIEIRLQDYRDLHERFDRIVSVGMFEHVGHKNYRNFIEIAHSSLHHDGLFLLHTIGANEYYPMSNEWTTKYIFPNGSLPTIAQIASEAEKLFVMEDWHNFGAYYDNTLMAWYENFTNHWRQLKKIYDERFNRMWTYYLLSCAGCFRARSLQLWQIVFSKKGVQGGYVAPR